MIAQNMVGVSAHDKTTEKQWLSVCHRFAMDLFWQKVCISLIASAACVFLATVAISLKV